MAIHRQHLAAALVVVFFQASPAAVAGNAWNDIVPDIANSIPSAAAQEIAPPRRIVDDVRRVADGRKPDTGVALAPADATQGASGPIAAHGAVDAAKPGIAATEASPDGAKAPAGARKSDERLDPDAKDLGPATTDAESEMVRVPAPIVKAARRALPGVAFKSVDLSRSEASTVYGLSGSSDSGRAVAVAIDQSGKVLKVDRQARDAEIPAEVMTLVEAVLPGARIERAMLSLRPNFVAVYVFSGDTASGLPFVLDIRSDGRSLVFVDPE